MVDGLKFANSGFQRFHWNKFTVETTCM